MAKRLKGSDLGYSSQGTPDPETLAELKHTYRDAAIGRGLPPKVLQQYFRLLELEAKARWGDDKANSEAAQLAKELSPFLSFDAEDVDWSN